MRNRTKILSGIISLILSSGAIADHHVADGVTDAGHKAMKSHAGALSNAQDGAVVHDVKTLSAGRSLQSLTPEQIDELEGHEIYSPGGDLLGDIDDIRVEKASGDTVAIVGIRGILGDNGKEVAMRLDELRMGGSRGQLTTKVTLDDLKNRSDVDLIDSRYRDFADDADADDGVKASRSLATLDGKNRKLSSMTGGKIGDLEGRKVYGADGELIGDVDSIRVEKASGKTVAIIGIRGIVGDAAKEVAMPLSELKRSPNSDALTTAVTLSDLKKRSDVDLFDSRYDDFEEEAE